MLLLALAPASVMGNTSSVFSPDVKAGDFSMEYRASYVPADGGVKSATAHRLHIQYALSDSVRVRMMGSNSRRGSGSYDYNYTRFELQHQYLENEIHGWDAAVRYELQLSDRGGANRARIGWTAKWDLDDRWQLRANLMLGRQFGENAGSGVFVETRGQITRRVGSGRIGLEMFNDLNQTTGFGSFDSQEHQLGPVLKYKFGELSVNASYLFGLSSSADDDNFRLHLIHPL